MTKVASNSNGRAVTRLPAQHRWYSDVLPYSTVDADCTWRRAIDGGADVRQPLHDKFWVELHGQITDPYGHVWWIAQRTREVPREELARAVAKAFGV